MPLTVTQGTHGMDFGHLLPGRTAKGGNPLNFAGNHRFSGHSENNFEAINHVSNAKRKLDIFPNSENHCSLTF